MMKKSILYTLCILLVLGIFVGCKGRDTKKNDETYFTATVLEKGKSYLLVEPVEGSSELASADRISVSIGDATLVESQGKEVALDDIEVGDKVQVFYNGEIAESYPAQINKCYKVVLSK